MSKQVQISEDLFREVWALLSFPDIDGWEDRRVLAVAALDEKIDRMINRELYTQYKTAPSKEQREEARRRYLDRKQIPEKCRW